MRKSKTGQRICTKEKNCSGYWSSLVFIAAVRILSNVRANIRGWHSKITGWQSWWEFVDKEIILQAISKVTPRSTGSVHFSIWCVCVCVRARACMHACTGQDNMRCHAAQWAGRFEGNTALVHLDIQCTQTILDRMREIWHLADLLRTTESDTL